MTANNIGIVGHHVYDELICFISCTFFVANLGNIESILSGRERSFTVYVINHDDRHVIMTGARRTQS